MRRSIEAMSSERSQPETFVSVSRVVPVISASAPCVRRTSMRTPSGVTLPKWSASSITTPARRAGTGWKARAASRSSALRRRRAFERARLRAMIGSTLARASMSAVLARSTSQSTSASTCSVRLSSANGRLPNTMPDSTRPLVRQRPSVLTRTERATPSTITYARESVSAAPEMVSPRS